MNALTYTHTRQHFAEVMRQVNDYHEPVGVTSQRGKPVVIMSLDDYQSLEETAYLCEIRWKQSICLHLLKNYVMTAVW